MDWISWELNEREVRSVPVPIVEVLFGATKLVSEADSNDVGQGFEDGGHSSEALNPCVRVEELIAKEAISVEVAAAPTWLAYVIVQYHHQLRLPQPPHHRL